MANASKCFSCARKNDYDPKFGYYGCKFSGQECKDYSMFEPKVKPRKPITHFDEIKAMSVEELAEFINGVEAEAIRRAGLFITVGDIQRGKEGWLDWLKQEADK